MNKLVVYLIYLFLFLLPWQTRLILRHGIINGGNWEYGIVGIYGTEVLLWIIFLLSLLRSGGKLHENTLSNFPAGNLRSRSASLVPRCGSGHHARSACCEGFLSKFPPLLIYFLLFAFFSIFLAADRLIAIQQSIHILEAVAAYILLTKLPIDRLKAAYAFLVGLAIQAGLGIYQFLTQSTFAFKWLGLTLHDATIGGASVLENVGGRWLRAYAGLPHPNVFGGYMVVGIMLIIVLLASNLFSNKVRIFLLIANCLLLTGLFFSFSRSAWIGLIVGLVFFWFFNFRQFIFNKSFKLFFLSSAVLLVILSLLYAPLLHNRLFGQGRLETRAVEERIGGYGEAWRLFKKNPLLGVGLGNYTLAIYDEIESTRPAWFYQPVHNVFLLIFTELGVVGVLVILLFGYFIKRIFSRNLLPLFTLFFLLVFFDHYLWSLYGGLMLIGVSAGLLTVMLKDGKEEYVPPQRLV